MTLDYLQVCWFSLPVFCMAYGSPSLSEHGFSYSLLKFPCIISLILLLVFFFAISRASVMWTSECVFVCLRRVGGGRDRGRESMCVSVCMHVCVYNLPSFFHYLFPLYSFTALENNAT